MDQKVTIRQINHEEIETILGPLVKLLQDVVNSGASVSFLPPLSRSDSLDFWKGTQKQMRAGTLLMLVAETDSVVGCVQLDLHTVPNGRHRAEVRKLLVHPEYRRRGIARTLMQQIEQVAMHHHRTLLVLDTWHGGSADSLYRKIGYLEAGVIPGYALNAQGSADATVVMYKHLRSVPSPLEG